MKRLLALVGLMIVCTGPVAADYLFIKIDLNKVNFGGGGDANGGAQPGVQPGVQPGFQPGAQPGFQPGGFGGGFGGKGMMKGGGKGFGGPGVGLQPPGLQGGGGLQPPGAPMGAVPPGLVQPGGEGGAAAAPASDQPPHYILAVVPLTSVRRTLPGFQANVGMEMDHIWGRKGRFPFVPGLVEYVHVAKDSVGKQFSKNYAKVVADAKDPAGLYQAASWALAHGLHKDFHASMAALAKADANHFAVKNYQRLQNDLKQSLGADDPATQSTIAGLKDEDYKLTLSEAGHYGILSKGAAVVASTAMKRRLARFETAFDNFFYWFALQEGVEQPALPKYRLYAVLVEDKEKFHALHSAWSGQPMVTDGFTPRRDNLIVLSAKRLDENYALFEKNLQALWSKGIVNRDELVTGIVWDKKDNKFDVFTGAALQTLALMQKSLDDDSERATISHEATRQLLLATGVLPRLVNVPEWIQSGMASYLDTSYGALYNGVGLPSWSHLVAFKHFRRANKLGATPYDALVNTISSKFFRDVLHAEEDQKDNLDGATQELKDANDIAHSTAWSLVYYIIQYEDKGIQKLMKYADELAKLPRDLDLDDRALQACFGRAFNLTDAKDPRRLDPEKGRVLANAWFNKMLGVTLEVIDAERELTAYRFPPPAKKKTATTPSGFPGAPMGFPGGANPNLLPGANPNAPPPAAAPGAGGGPRGGG
jgi:hypothetical protein